MISLITFIVCYTLFIIEGKRRALIAMIGSLLLLITQSVTPLQMITLVHWNVIGLFFGTLILAELFMQSAIPAVMAEWVVDHTKTAKGAIVAICALASALSIFIENVAVVLLVAPIAIKLCEKIHMSPIKPLIFIAIFSNIQGTATLIGDPPSMILASYLKMNFIQFFVYEGKLSIFFFIQAGAIAGLYLVYFMMRKHAVPIERLNIETPRSFIPLILLIILVFLLSLASWMDPDFDWYAGTVSMLMAFIGLMWYVLGPHWTPVQTLIYQLDWETTIFLIGMFILVGAIIDAGWIKSLSLFVTPYLGGSPLSAFIAIIIFSILVSAVIDNVPYLLAMIPVVEDIAANLGTSVPLLMFALLLGSCLGGNVTPIGASANIVAVGLLKKYGHPVEFWDFMKIGLFLTVVTVTISAVCLWAVWSPA